MDYCGDWGNWLFTHDTNINEIIEEARRVISQYNDFKSLVTDDMEVMETYIGKLCLQVARMVEVVS